METKFLYIDSNSSLDYSNIDLLKERLIGLITEKNHIVHLLNIKRALLTSMNPSPYEMMLSDDIEFIIESLMDQKTLCENHVQREDNSLVNLYNRRCAIKSFLKEMFCNNL